ncbi:MAG: M20/M25/M40 family metallo-hydrolase, partial [Eubacteriales bacterium]|nr:M20/M25/M40 family metallo-hydrolase [Eubacteriales bacterium]
GGNQPSTVPESCLIKLDRRWINGESVESVYAELQGAIDALRIKDPHFEAELSRDMTNLFTMEHGPVCIDPVHPVVQALCNALTLLTGETPEKAAFPGWTDASLLGNFGHIPTLIAGPGDIACAHSEREQVTIAQLELAAQAYALLCLTF